MRSQQESPSLLELGARLKVRQAQFVRAACAMAETARAADVTDEQIVRARAELGRAIRERRSAIVSFIGAIRGYGLSLITQPDAAKDRLQAVGVPHLGR